MKSIHPYSLWNSNKWKNCFREMILAVGVGWKKFDLIEVVRVDCVLFVLQLLNQSAILTGIPVVKKYLKSSSRLCADFRSRLSWFCLRLWMIQEQFLGKIKQFASESWTAKNREWKVLYEPLIIPTVMRSLSNIWLFFVTVVRSAIIQGPFFNVKLQF